MGCLRLTLKLRNSVKLQRRKRPLCIAIILSLFLGHMSELQKTVCRKDSANLKTKTLWTQKRNWKAIFQFGSTFCSRLWLRQFPNTSKIFHFITNGFSRQIAWWCDLTIYFRKAKLSKEELWYCILVWFDGKF